jgi:hypothetical protein
MGERGGRASVLAISQDFASAGRLWRDYLKSLENDSGVPLLAGGATQKNFGEILESGAVRRSAALRSRPERGRQALIIPLKRPLHNVARAGQTREKFAKTPERMEVCEGFSRIFDEVLRARSSCAEIFFYAPISHKLAN